LEQGIIDSGMSWKLHFDARFVKIDFWRFVEEAAERRRSPKRFAPSRTWNLCGLPTASHAMAANT